MAITVKTTPLTYGTYRSAHDDLYFVVDSSNKAQPNFKYLFDVYVDGSIVGSYEIAPHPSHFDYGIFNAKTVVRAYLDSLYFKGESGFLTAKTADGFFSKGFVIKYGEVYGTTVTTYTNLVVSPTYTVYNCYNDLSPVSGGLDSYAAKFLSARVIGANQYTVTNTDKFYVYYFNPAATSKTFTITKYNALGVALGTQTTSSSAVLIQLNCGVTAINALFSGFIDSNVNHYTIDDGSNYISLKLDSFPMFEHYHVVFLNRLGGYESAHFRMKNRRTVGTERNTYGKRNYTMHTSAGSISYYDSTGIVRIGSGGTMSVKHSNKFRLCSDFLKDDEFEMMQQMFTSPVVYLELADGYFPVKILMDSFELKTRAVHGLQAFEVEVEVLESFNSQFL